MTISQPVLLPLRPILFDAVTNEPSCTCSRGPDCNRIGKHVAVFAWRDTSFGDEVVPDVDAGEGVAIKTGAHPKGSDVVVVDLDGAAAIEAWDAMHKASGELEIETRMVQTGRAEGGVQLYFACEPGLRVASSQSALAPKIDVRGEGGIAVLEESPHKAGPEVRYELLSDPDTPPAPMPRWFVEWCRARAAESPAEAKEYPGDVTDPEELEYRRQLYTEYLQNTPLIRSEENRGKGDTNLFSVVQYGGYDLRLPDDDILDLLEEHYDPRNDRTWGDELPERVYHKSNDAKTRSTRPRIEIPPNPAKRPRVGELFSSTIDLDPRSISIEDLAPREIDPDDPPVPEGRLGFRWGRWAAEPPPIEFLVENLVPKASVGCVYGKGDALKTWITYDLARACAAGQHWLGRRTRPGGMRVGIVDYETGRHNLTRRLYMLRAGDCEQLGAVSMPKGERPNDDEFWCKLEEEKLDLAIIDSLRMANPGANENDSAEAILPLDAAGRFAELTGCAVLFIHHANKSSGDGWPDMRGSGAINDQLDYAFAVRKLDVSNEDKRVEVKCTKPGDMRAPDPFTVQVLFDDAAKRATVALAPDDGAGASEGGGAGPTQDTDTTAQIQQRVKLLLASGPIETKSLIREKVTGNRSRVLAAIEALEVREEIAFLKGIGYVLDSEDARIERVLEQAERHARWKSPAELAKASDVQTPFVERLVKDGVLTPRLSGPSPGGYLVDRSKVRLFGG